MTKTHIYQEPSLRYVTLILLVCILLCLCGTSCAKDDANAICQTETGYAIPPANPKVTFWDKALALVGYEGKIDEFCILSVAALNNGMPELAIDYCDAALKCNRDCWKPWALKAMCYMELAKNDWKKYGDILCNSFSRAYLCNKDRETFYFCRTDSVTFYDVLQAYCECSIICGGHYDEIISTTQKELCYYPNDANLINFLSLAYTKKGIYNFAQQWAIKLGQINPAMGYFRLGYIVEEQHNYRQAIDYYDKVLEINPQHTAAKKHREACYRELHPCKFDEKTMKFISY